MTNPTESDKFIGEIRSIQKELDILEQEIENLAEVLFTQKTSKQQTRKRKNRKLKPRATKRHTGQNKKDETALEIRQNRESNLRGL